MIKIICLMLMVTFWLIPLPRTGLAQSGVITVGVACQLPDAILSANTDQSRGGCVAGNGEDVIELTGDVELSQAIDFTEGNNALPPITSTITINGHGYMIRLTLGSEFSTENARLFLVLHDDEVGFAGDLTLNEVTLTGGNSSRQVGYEGGAVAVEGGKVTLNDSHIMGNTGGVIVGAAGIYVSGGEAYINGTIFEGNEGYAMVVEREGYARLTGTLIRQNARGIFIRGTSRLDVVESGFVENDTSGFRRGVITNVDGYVQIKQSSFFRNERPIYNDKRGNLTVVESVLADNLDITIMNEGQMTLINSTLVNNSLGGVYNTGSLTVLNVTLVGNNLAGEEGQGGLANLGGTVSLTNSIVAYNLGGDCYALDAYSQFEGTFNRDGDGSCPDSQLITGLDTQPDHWGGLTQTLALQATSNAIDAGDVATCPETDQRAAIREGVCDIGAFEWNGQLPEE